MSKRLVFVTLLTAALVGGLAYFQYVFKPQMIAGFIAKAPQPAVTVTTEPARAETWRERETSIGTLVSSEGIDVAAQVGGIVQRVYFDSGQNVAKGAPLVDLDTDIEKADLASNRATLKEAELGWQRQEDLKRKAVTSEANVDAARARRDTAAAAVAKTEATISKKSILAPFAGRLGIRKVEVGQYVSPGLALATLQALDPIRVDFPMPERAIAGLSVGQTIEVTVDAYPGQVFNGTIQVLDARVAADTRTLTVRGILPNPDAKLLPGMFANVAIVAPTPANVVTVPRTAVTYSLYGNNVWVVKPAAAKAAPAPSGPSTGSPGTNASPETNPSAGASAGSTATVDQALTVERRFVRTGDTQGERTAIREGLAAGERVVSSGQLKLNPGVPIKLSTDNPLTPAAVRPAE